MRWLREDGGIGLTDEEHDEAQRGRRLAEASFPHLFRLIEGSDGEVVAEALVALTEISLPDDFAFPPVPPELPARVAPLLGHADERIVLLALQALRRFAAPYAETITALLARLGHLDETPRLIALYPQTRDPHERHARRGHRPRPQPAQPRLPRAPRAAPAGGPLGPPARAGPLRPAGHHRRRAARSRRGRPPHPRAQRRPKRRSQKRLSEFEARRARE